MKVLIVEDDCTSGVLLQECLKEYGPTHLVVNGQEAVHAARIALEAGEPYDLICLDIVMPEMDGQETLQIIREMEESVARVRLKAKIVMTTALNDTKNIMSAYASLCDGYLIKPVSKAQVLGKLREIGILS
jgi:two-component system chemotaxis response regulator CheY